MKERNTLDGSVTWFSKEYNQDYHSHAGAYLEANKLFVEGCDLIEKAKKKNKINILDVGFGLGYNAFVPILRIHEVNPQCEVKVISFEKDETVLLFDQYPSALFLTAKKIKSNWVKTKNLIHFKDATTELKIYLGDARDSIQQIKKTQFDAVFQDAFSPPYNPELWTVEFFTALRKRLKKRGRLATYSIATPVLIAMRQAGLHPYLAAGSGTKRYSTLATKVPTQPLSERFLKKLETSPEKVPYCDPNLNGSKEQIIQNREKIKEQG